MTPSDDLFPPRRPIFFPVVIATVFLTIIAGTVGFMLGERHRSDGRGAGPGETNETQGVSNTSASSAPSEPACPEAVIQTADRLGLPTDLRQVFKIVTERRTVVWICQDGGGKLYFQSKTPKTQDADEPLIQGKNALFLNGVQEVGNDEYTAVASDGNSFEVNRRQLVVHFVSGKDDDVQAVVSAE
ncbi:hypothetical protein ODJ79_04660 [Actinoplanes sp. KI2]|uniref:hypothetical protein n=1 Tax=Actinoplanes sp. KI2 TaxID=2983315 RepID=UPI0021D601ED|nr:hypothetical protein [Actinoplanes sp. KI2]MCU7722998.1 hypothetical protein [Actinoplanes sp. KI2]